MPDSRQWLESNHIRYVLWLAEDNKLPPHTFEKLNDLIKDRYWWHEYYTAPDYHIGMWSAY